MLRLRRRCRRVRLKDANVRIGGLMGEVGQVLWDGFARVSAAGWSYASSTGNLVVDFTLRMMIVDRSAAISLSLVISLSSWNAW